ncbi:MAG: hypothetical protein K8S16_02210 [Bacteroidales bacterium]|nr:hypothetical protein [Bacteroidales bacterium]
MKIQQLTLTLFFIYLINLSNAQVLVNNGSEIFVSEGSNLVIVGDYQNLSDGEIENSGDINITGDWINNANSGNLLQNTLGTVNFFGTETQHISGAQKTWFNKLNLQNNVEVETETSVSSELVFTNTFLSLFNADLIMEPASQINGYSSSGYIIAENSGQLKQTVSNDNIEFPVGTISYYVPLILNNFGVIDTFGVKVFNDVLENGLSGPTIPEINHCVNNTWNITEQTPGGSDLSITASWNASLEGVNFDRLNCGLGHYTEGAWDPQTDTIATGSNPYSVTKSGITELSAFAVGDTSSPMAITLRLTLDITAFLEGPFNGTNMNTGLNPDYIPLSQPYNTSPWNYSGTESVDFIPNADVVDWVLIELRDTTEAALATGETMIAQKAVFLLNDGSVVGLDGNSSNGACSVTAPIIKNNLFVVIWHRNHLGIISAYPVTESCGVYTYDFTTSTGQAFESGQKDLGGQAGMFAGDGNANGHINATDKTNWSAEAGKKGYLSNDYTMDSQVSNKDKNEVWIENEGISSSAPE